MRALTISRHGGPEVLEVREHPDPQPGPAEVRILVAAAGLNFADVMARVGLYPDAPRPPCVVGYEVAGTIDAVGAGVAGLGIGDRVVAMPRFGGQSDLVCVPVAQVLPIPTAMSFEHAAALPVVYVTAYHMIHVVATVRPGATVLVHMAAGGVGLAAIQLLRLIPGVTLFGTASGSKHEVLRQAGVAHPIDYRQVDFAAEIQRLTSGRGVDVVLDPLGGADWKRNYRLVAPAGHLVCFGVANLASGRRRRLLHVIGQMARMPRFSPVRLMNDNKSVSGVNMGHLWGDTALLRGELEQLLALYGAGSIVPHVDSTFPFSRAADAHAQLEERRNVGKVLLTPG
jgi:NADPH:quinone reductase-like Zn-dependent oxidoreductase